MIRMSEYMVGKDIERLEQRVRMLEDAISTMEQVITAVIKKQEGNAEDERKTDV